jgi:ariadne-1
MQVEQDFSNNETQYLQKAVDVLGKCRRTLMYSYGFAYYLQKNHQVTIFEDNQSDLEQATEGLSGLLEGELPYDVDMLKKWKQSVQDKSRYVESRREALLHHVDEGRTRNEWKFNLNK